MRCRVFFFGHVYLFTVGPVELMYEIMEDMVFPNKEMVSSKTISSHWQKEEKYTSYHRVVVQNVSSTAAIRFISV